jgi:hypothetical protein
VEGDKHAAFRVREVYFGSTNFSRPAERPGVAKRIQQSRPSSSSTVTPRKTVSKDLNGELKVAMAACLHEATHLLQIAYLR